MKAVALLLAATLVSCGESGVDSSRTWLGDACGVPALGFTVDERRKMLRLEEYQVQGTVMGATGLESAPVSDRQRAIERALPCLEREAGRRGLKLEYPVVNVDG